MRSYFLAIAYLLAWSAHASTNGAINAAILPTSATVEECAQTIATQIIAAGDFKDVQVTGFQCASQFLRGGRMNCTFTGLDQSAPRNSYRGNIEVERHLRIQEDSRTGARSEAQYCRIASACLFNTPWPFNLRNVNGSVIQRESACRLDSDLVTDLF